MSVTMSDECQNIGGVVNTGRPLQVKYWGVATPATPAALTPMVELLQVSPDQFVFCAANEP